MMLLQYSYGNECKTCNKWFSFSFWESSICWVNWKVNYSPSYSSNFMQCVEWESVDSVDEIIQSSKFGELKEESRLVQKVTKLNTSSFSGFPGSSPPLCLLINFENNLPVLAKTFPVSLPNFNRFSWAIQNEWMKVHPSKSDC